MSHPKEIKPLLEKTRAALSKNTQTPAGQTTSNYKKTTPKSSEERAAYFGAINNLIAQLEMGYHNQWYSAYPTVEKQDLARKFWTSHLKHLDPAIITQATTRVIAESDYLPTVHKFLLICDSIDSHGLPSARGAYIEACNASKPRRDHSWSHPAVYFAGQDSDWFFLQSSTEQKAYPVFKSHYDKLCERVRGGESLTIEPTPALPSSINRPLNAEQRREALDKLKQDTGL
jgi:hypothetical protein